MNFEHLAERCLMERADQLEMVWRHINKFDNWRDIVDFMKEKRFTNREPLENGAFSHVFTSAGGEYVLKISRKEQDGWRVFAQVVAARELYKTNPLFPVIPAKYIKVVDGGGENWGKMTIAFIEHLNVDPSRNREIGSEVYNMMPEENRPKHFSPGHIFIDSMESYYDKGKKHYLDTFICKVFDINPKHLYEYYDILKPIYAKYALDLHASNFGFRSNGEVVLFDPFSYG